MARFLHPTSHPNTRRADGIGIVEAHSRYFSETAYAAAAEPKELMLIPGAVHTDLYYRVDVIPFDKLTAFFKQHLA